MNAVELLQDLASRGFKVRALSGGQLAVFPKLPADVREAVKQLKPELLMILQQSKAGPKDSLLDHLATTDPNNWPRLQKCPHCETGLVSRETGEYSLAQCPDDGTHFMQLRNKNRTKRWDSSLRSGKTFHVVIVGSLPSQQAAAVRTAGNCFA